jgi:hypothetical protein
MVSAGDMIQVVEALTEPWDHISVPPPPPPKKKKKKTRKKVFFKESFFACTVNRIKEM